MYYKHGMTRTPEYSCWLSMKNRCYNPHHKKFYIYGGRTPPPITVCEAWREDFMAFYRDMGPRPGLEYSLDRIDNEQGYSPGNVRWATTKEQNRNKRNNTYLIFEEESQLLIDVARKINLKPSTLSNRVKRHTPLHQPVQAPRRVHPEERFGSLVAKRPTEKRDRDRGVVWLCQCDCGKSREVIARHLRSGNTRSCGCNRRKNILHQRFGSLVAMMPTDKRDSSGGMIWRCQCDCGKIIEVRSTHLCVGNTRSCGCQSYNLPHPTSDPVPVPVSSPPVTISTKDPTHETTQAHHGAPDPVPPASRLPGPDPDHETGRKSLDRDPASALGTGPVSASGAGSADGSGTGDGGCWSATREGEKR